MSSTRLRPLELVCFMKCWLPRHKTRCLTDCIKAITLLLFPQTRDEGYVLATEHGHLSDVYSRASLAPSPTGFVSLEDIPEGITLSLREVARLTSGGSGQGVWKCVCRKSCTGRCKCRRDGRKCSSRCHKSTKCNNK